MQAGIPFTQDGVRAYMNQPFPTPVAHQASAPQTPHVPSRRRNSSQAQSSIGSPLRVSASATGIQVLDPNAPTTVQASASETTLSQAATAGPSVPRMALSVLPGGILPTAFSPGTVVTPHKMQIMIEQAVAREILHATPLFITAMQQYALQQRGVRQPTPTSVDITIPDSTPAKQSRLSTDSQTFVAPLTPAPTRLISGHPRPHR